VKNVKIIIKIGGENMDEEKELNEIVAEMRREKAKIWRANNKEKVKEINKRYWLKKAKKVLEERQKTNLETKEGE
jgi:bifunctional N-acetylglucosamine-1-phosphate-uridyltransferase/glucosamine-1-phosphate-acetyltransferase GlmU-like protein